MSGQLKDKEVNERISGKTTTRNTRKGSDIGEGDDRSLGKKGKWNLTTYEQKAEKGRRTRQQTRFSDGRKWKMVGKGKNGELV